MRKTASKTFSMGSATATVLLIALLLSILTPTLIQFSAAADSLATTMHKEVDIFEGSFSSQEVAPAANQAFDVSFSICPTIDAPNTVIRFIVPGALVKLVKGDKTWTGDVAKGETITLSLSFATDGEVEAYVRADVEASPPGKNHRSSYFLHVATPNAQPGELRAVNAVATDSNPESSRAVANPESPGTIRIYGTMKYVNELGGNSPARYMLVEIWDEDTFGDEYVTGQWTNANGQFDITCNNDDGFLQDGRDPYVVLWAIGEWDWFTKNSGGTTYSWRTEKLGDDVPDGWVKNIGTRVPAVNNDALQAGDACFAEAQWIYDRTLWARPTKVDIRWPEGTWPHSHGNSIHLPLKSTWAWTHVTVHHEYAHCVMWALYGHWPPGSGPDPHYVYSESSGGFAMSEGWCEFMQCAVDNIITNLQGWYGGHGGNIETNDWFNCIDTGDFDGSIVEGSVASIFWDIFDPVNIPGDDDHMGWGFDELFIVIRYDQPDNMFQFWDKWKARWPTVSTSVGPLCDIYWNYGIDEDYPPWGNPWGSIIINAGATYTTSRWVTLTLSADDWGSGVRWMRFSNNIGATWSAWIAYATTYSYYMANPGDGYKYVDVQYADYWMQTSTYLGIFDGITLDTTAPTGSIIINSGNPAYTTSTSVTLYLTYSDATSGVDQVRFQNAGGAWSAWMAPSATKAWTLVAGDGTKTVYYQVRDKAGLISATYFDTIILDTIAPVTTISHSPGSSTVSLSATDATSGVFATYYRIDLGAWITYVGPFTLTGTGTHTIDYYSRDKAGNNEALKQLKVHYLTVNTDPAGITTISGTGWYNQGTTAATGTAPATVTVGGITYTFSTWKKDGAPVGGNPISVFMDAPHTATAVYTTAVTASFKIWTDKTVYNIGQTMKVYVRVKNPSATPLPVRAKIFLKLPGGALYGPLLDLTTTLPALFDSGDVLWQSFTIPSVPLGFYGWVAELRNPTTNALISQDTWNWELA